MPLRSDWSGDTCPIARSLDVVGDPWVLLILREAMEGARRFDEFRARLGVADSVLSRRLTALVDAELLQRNPYRDGQRERLEYVLTEAGADLLPVMNALALWGEKYRPHPHRDVFLDVVHLDCGADSSDGGICTACGKPMTPGRVAWRLGAPNPRLIVLAAAQQSEADLRSE
jgi:DNA-binding HxlR family transcriptional regulator